jgi:folylpolyglutamate synthase/dihydropteroate synthase
VLDANAEQQALGGGAAGAAARLQQLQQGLLPQAYCEGLKRAAWPGRSQVGTHTVCTAHTRNALLDECQLLNASLLEALVQSRNQRTANNSSSNSSS